jgi:hypothetical protein
MNVNEGSVRGIRSPRCFSARINPGMSEVVEMITPTVRGRCCVTGSWDGVRPVPGPGQIAMDSSEKRSGDSLGDGASVASS